MYPGPYVRTAVGTAAAAAAAAAAVAVAAAAAAAAAAGASRLPRGDRFSRFSPRGGAELEVYPRSDSRSSRQGVFRLLQDGEPVMYLYTLYEIIYSVFCARGEYKRLVAYTRIIGTAPCFRRRQKKRAPGQSSGLVYADKRRAPLSGGWAR